MLGKVGPPKKKRNVGLVECDDYIKNEKIKKKKRKEGAKVKYL